MVAEQTRCRPPPDFYKNNWDAVLMEKHNCADFGVIIRENLGRVTRSMCIKARIDSEVIEAKAMAATSSVNDVLHNQIE